MSPKNGKKPPRRDRRRRPHTRIETSKDARTFELVLPHGMYNDIYEFLFSNPETEHLGVILAGVHQLDDRVRLLGRRFVRAEHDDCEVESAASIRARQEFSREIMQLCEDEGLSQIDVHSHPFGAFPEVTFSAIDDDHEREMAEYIYEKLPNTWYASLVFNQGYFDGRVWLTDDRRRTPVAVKGLDSLTIAGFPWARELPSCRRNSPVEAEPELRVETGRQVLAFGHEGQQAMASAVVGVVGLGGLGSILVEGLARLGVSQFVLFDPDTAETTNLNRVMGMTAQDVELRRSKVEIAERLIAGINPKAEYRGHAMDVLSEEAVRLLGGVDLLFLATDNHASRMLIQAVASQYLLPLFSVGVDINIDEAGDLLDVSGEVITVLPGTTAGGCLACLDRYNPTRARLERVTGMERARAERGGYISDPDVPAPSVRHLNGVVADLALAEFHNLFCSFKAPALWVEYDQLKTLVRARDTPRQDGCIVCSDDARLGLGDLESLDPLWASVDEVATLTETQGEETTTSDEPSIAFESDVVTNEETVSSVLEESSTNTVEDN